MVEEMPGHYNSAQMQSNSTKTKFDEFVAKQSSEPLVSEIDWSIKRDEWLQHIDIFYVNLKSYLNEYVTAGKIKVNYGKKKIVEEYIGEYEAITAMIYLGKNQVKLEPIGTNLIGAKGRIDMIGPNGTVRFVLVDKNASFPRISVRIWIDGEDRPPEVDKPPAMEWVWKISTPPPRIKYIELNSESFFDAFMEVANG